MLTPQLLKLLQHMSDGAYHSGEALGKTLGVSRAAVWKTLEGLSDFGLEVQRTRGKGYCLVDGLAFLDEAEIRQSLSIEAASELSCLEIFNELDSTNQYLLNAVAQGDQRGGRVCLAEMQHAGRGRRGRTWQSPFAQNIYFSMTCRFQRGVASMEGLSLAVGVAVVKALSSLGAEKLALKWPNDILFQGAKLGGVLIEIAGDVTGECYAVIGVGINAAMRDAFMEDVDQPWANLRDAMSGVVSRNVAAAAMLNELLPLVQAYEQKGFTAYRADWERYCAHMGQRIVISSPAQAEVGVMLGVDDTGALRLDVNGEEKVYAGGEISLRALS